MDAMSTRRVSDPPRMDREARKFCTYEEAERAMGCALPEEVRRLYKQPRYEQRTDMWFKERYQALTASDFAAAIDEYKRVFGTPRSVFRKKTGRGAPFRSTAATEHGVFYEDVAAHRYEVETGKKILDFGLLSDVRLYEKKPDDVEPSVWAEIVHAEERDERYFPTEEEWEAVKDLTWLKGSPDGVTTDGVLVEIKCPFRAEIEDAIPPHYYPQVQLLLHLLDLELCHFVQYRPKMWWEQPERFSLVEVRRDRAWFAPRREKARRLWNDVLATRRWMAECDDPSDMIHDPVAVVDAVGEEEAEEYGIVLDYRMPDDGTAAFVTRPGTMVTREEEERKNRKRKTRDAEELFPISYDGYRRAFEYHNIPLPWFLRDRQAFEESKRTPNFSSA